MSESEQVWVKAHEYQAANKPELALSYLHSYVNLLVKNDQFDILNHFLSTVIVDKSDMKLCYDLLWVCRPVKDRLQHHDLLKYRIKQFSQKKLDDFFKLIDAA